MISTRTLHRVPAGVTLAAEDLVEFHASRLILVIALCGKRDNGTKLPRLDGLTKLAKLDFLIRYPSFLRRVAEHRGVEVQTVDEGVEPRMIRHHYGPWDPRYYHVLAFLESRRLLTIRKDDRSGTTQFFLTAEGQGVAARMKETSSFQTLINLISEARRTVGNLTGNQIKELIYELFEQEVAALPRGRVIENA